MKIDIARLMTVKNYAFKFRVTPSYIYKLIKEEKMKAVTIDDVLFVDAILYPKIPIKK